jgi:hypothetical protein
MQGDGRRPRRRVGRVLGLSMGRHHQTAVDNQSQHAHQHRYQYRQQHQRMAATLAHFAFSSEAPHRNTFLPLFDP